MQNLCMALTEAQKSAILNSALGSKRVSVDGLTTEKRSVSELREIVELCEDLNAESVAPTARIGMASMIPPGSLDD